METKQRRMLAYLATLYVPKERIADYEECCHLVSRLDLRDVEPSDARKNAIPVLVLRIAGKGRLATYKGYSILRCDFNQVGNTYAEAYVYEQLGTTGLPQRVFRTGVTFAVINRE